MTSFALTETLQMQPLRFCGPIKQPHSSWRANSCFCNAEEWVGAMIVSFSLSLSPPTLRIWGISKEFCVAQKVFVVAVWFWQGKWQFSRTTCRTWTQENAPLPWRRWVPPTSCLSVTSL